MSAKALIDALAARGWRITTAESCTGGGVAAAITDIAGSSAVFEQGVITYSNTAKTALLCVQTATLDAHGAVSEPVASEMAQGALTRAGADIAISVTGIAGPGGSEHKPEGRVCFGIATATETLTETVEFGPIGRANVRAASAAHALALALEATSTATPPESL